MNEDHPFVEWWITESRWHDPGEDWKASLACSEGTLAIEAWNAAVDNTVFRMIGNLPDGANVVKAANELKIKKI